MYGGREALPDDHKFRGQRGRVRARYRRPQLGRGTEKTGETSQRKTNLQLASGAFSCKGAPFTPAGERTKKAPSRGGRTGSNGQQHPVVIDCEVLRNGVLVAPLRVSYALLGEWALFRRCQGSLPRYGDLETQTPTHVEPDTRPIPLELPTSGLCGAVRSILRIGRDTSARESPSPKTGPLHDRTGNRIGGYPASSGGGRKRPRSGAYHQANAPPFRGF